MKLKVMKFGMSFSVKSVPSFPWHSTKFSSSQNMASWDPFSPRPLFHRLHSWIVYQWTENNFGVSGLETVSTYIYFIQLALNQPLRQPASSWDFSPSPGSGAPAGRDEEQLAGRGGGSPGLCCPNPVMFVDLQVPCSIGYQYCTNNIIVL